MKTTTQRSPRTARRRRHARRAFRPAKRFILVGSILGVFGLGVSLQGATPTVLNWDPGFTNSASGGGAGTWDPATTADWFNALTPGDQLWQNDGTGAAIFGGTAGTVTTSGALSVGALTFNTGGYLVNGTGTLTLASAATSGQLFPTISVSVGNTDTINAILAGLNGVHVAGGGKLIAGGANTLSGGISLDSAAGQPTTLQAGAANVLNSNVISFTGVGTSDLQLNGFSQIIGGLSGAGGTVENASNTAATLTLADATSQSFGGVIQNGAGTGALSLIVNNTAGVTQTLSGANTYTGTTTITGGILSVGSVVVSAGASGLGNAASAVVLGGGGVLSYTGANATFTRGLTINTGGGEVDSTTNTLTISTPLALTTAGLTFGGAGNVTVSTGSTVPFTGTNTLTKTGAGTLSIQTTTAASTAAAMPIVIGAGTLTQNITTATNLTNSLGTGSITIAPGATLNLSNAAATDTYSNALNVSSGSGNAVIQSASGVFTFSGAVTLPGAGAGLQLNNTNNSVSLLTLSGNIGGTGNIALNGTGVGGTISLTTGTIAITGGISNIGTSATATATISAPITTTNLTSISQAGTSPFTVTSALALTGALNSFTSTGAGLFTLSGALSGTQPLTLNANSTGGITLGAVNTTGTITNSGTGAGTTTIGGVIAATVTGVTENSATSPLTASGGLVVAAAGTTLLNSNASGTQILNVSGAVSGTGNLILNNNSAIGTALATVGGTTGGITLGAVNNIGTLTNSGSGTGPVYITGAIGTAVTAINQISTTSPLVITGGTAGTTTGTVTIANGSTVQLGNQAANNLALGTGTIATNTSGTLIFAPGTTSLTYPNVITGSGTVTLNGLATAVPAGITLSATTGTFTGNYILNQGRLAVTAQTNLGSATAPITVNGTTSNGGQFWLNANVTIANPITINGYGASEAAGNLGAVRFNTGTLSNTITLGSNASLDPQNTTATVSGNIVGPFQLLIGTPASNQGGTLTLTGAANTYSGGTLIAGATAAGNVAGAFGSAGAVVLQNFSNSGLTESVANALTGTNSLTVQGGTATLSVANNYTGGTTVSGGTLTSSTTSLNLGTGSVAVSGGTFNANFASTLFGGISGGLNYANNLAQTGGAVVTITTNAFAGTASLNLSGGTTSIGAAQAYTGGANISGTNVTTISSVAGTLPGATTVSGGGTLSSSVASFTTPGTPNLTGGSLGGAITVNSGGILTSAAAGGSFTNVSVNSGGIVNPGGVGTVGTAPLTINGLATVSGALLQFDIASTASFDSLTVGNLSGLGVGGYSFGAGTLVTPLFFGQLSTIAGSYNLINYTGAAPTLGALGLAPSTAPSGITYALNETTPGVVQLVISGSYAGVSSSWIPTSAGPNSWNTATNWTGSVIPHLTGDTANFATTNPAPQTVTVDGQQHVGTLTLNPTTSAYVINQGTAGSAIYLDNGASAAQINNATLSNTIAAPLVLLSSNTNVTAGTGTNLTLSGVISGTGRLTLASGTGSVTVTGATPSYTGGTEIDSGSIIINNASGGAFTQLNNAGVGTTTLNGGTLSFTGVSGTATTTPAGFVINVGGSGGTLNVGVSGSSTTNGKVNIQNPAWLTGSGTLTKTGGSDLQVNSASPGFTGNVVLSNSGLIEDQNVASLGFGTSTGFNGGSVTLNGPSGTNAPELVAGGVQIFNPITLAGGTLSANGNNNGIFNSTVNVTSASILRASQFQGQTVAQNFAVNTLTGSSPLAVNGSTTANAIGMVTLGTASGYTGVITVGANAALGLGSGAGFLGGTIANFTNATSGIGLLADGDGSGTPETINYTLPSQITAALFGAGNTTGYIVGKQGATTLFNQAANKTISLASSLPFNNPAANTLNVQPFNGYGLLLTAQPALTATTTFGVGTVTSVGGVAPAGQASNVIPGLTITNLSGSFGILKTGPGTLQLGTNAADNGNTFGNGTATTINVTGGTVSAFADANLGGANNGITLNNTTSAEFLALASFATSRTITLTSATGATIGVAGGQTLTLNTGLNYGAVGNTLTKVENGTLLLTAPAVGGPTSTTAINAGALQISASGQIGSGAITVANSVGTALQVTGGVTFTQALSLSSGGIQGKGALENVTGANTFSGAVTIANAAIIGNDDAANVLTLSNAVFTNTNGFLATGAGAVVVSGALTGNGTFGVAPGGTLRITAAANNTSTSVPQIFGGALVFTGAGTQSTAGGVPLIAYGGTLTFDDVATNTAGRSGGHTHSFASGGGGTIALLGNAAAASVESFNGFTTGRGEDILQITPGAGQSATLTLTIGGSFTRNNFASLMYQAPGLGSAAGANIGVIAEGPVANTGFQGAFVTGGQINQQIQPWALAYNTSNATSAITFATANAATGAIYRPLASNEATAALAFTNGNVNSATGASSTTNASPTVTVTSTAGLFAGEAVTGAGIPAGAYIASITNGTTYLLSANATATAAGVVTTYSTAGDNISTTTALNTATLITQAPAINSLTLATGGSLAMGNSYTLTIGGGSGGGILATDTTSGNTISGTGIITAGANELDIHTVGNLTVNSTITGGGGGAGVGLTKGESGTLTLTGNSFHTGQTVVNAGTLALNAGNNTIQFANYLTLGAGSTLNLNGNSQIVTDLLTDSTAVTGLGTVGSNSTITGTAGAALVIKEDASRAYTGSIQGSTGVAFAAAAAALTKTLTLPQTYSGPTLINGATVLLQNTAAVPNTSSLTINRGGLTLDNTGSVDSSTRLPSGLAISLGGGTITYNGRAQFASAETLGAITAAEGANTLTVTAGGTGVNSAVLTLTSLARTAGATINFTSAGTLGTIGSAPQILVTGTSATTAGGTTSLLGGGFTVNGSDFAAYNATYGVGALGTTGFAGYSPLLINNAASTDNVSMGAGSVVNLNSQTINSLRLTGTSAINFNASQTLTLASGGFLINNTGSVIGNSVNNGAITSGGSELFLYVGGTTTVNSAVKGAGVALVKSGSSTLNLAGTNTYTGGTYVDQGTLTLGNAGNVTLGQSTLGTGGIFLNGGTLTQTAGSLIPSQAVTITGNGVLNTVSDLVTAATSVTTFGSNTIAVPNGALGVNGIHVGDLVTGTGIPGSEFVTAVNPATNTVTITSGSGVLNGGAVALTFRNLSNTISGLTFNNDGGVTAPTLSNTGLLNITSGTITASANNVGSASLITGGSVDLANVASPTITVNPIVFNGQNIAPLQPTLTIASAIQDASNPISITGGGNLALSGASTFTGGVNLAAGTNLTITTSTVNNAASGQPLSGPLGTGTLTIGTGSTLYADTTGRAAGNSVIVSGNFSFDATTAAAAALTLGAGSQTTALPAGVATTITVNAPNMTGVLNDTVTGAGSTIVKAGLGTLQLSNGVGGNSSFSGGVVLNAGTLQAVGVGGGTTALGSGPVIINGGLLDLRHSGNISNGLITYGNNVQISTALANAYINVQNNGANTGNTINLGTLDYGTVTGNTFASTVTPGSAAPGTILNVTGANNYKLQFTGTSLTGTAANPTTGNATFNVGSGLTVILNGGATGFSAANAPVNIGPGTLALTGNNTFPSAPISGAQTAYVYANQSTTPIGTGGITLSTGANLVISPLYSSAMRTTGYTLGGVTAKYYFSGVGGTLAAANFGIAPDSTLAGVPLNDSSLRMSPFGVNNNGAASNTLVTYQSLLTVTSGGTYTFGAGGDDNVQVVVDGQTLQATNSGTGTALNQLALQSVNLSPGVHQIVVREMNIGSGGGSYVYYSGPDTAANTLTGTPPANNLQVLPLTALAYATNFTAANNYQNAAILGNALSVAAAATVTIDGAGTDFNYGVPSLALLGGSTLNVINGTGTAFGSAGNGVFVVTGTTALSGAINTVNPGTGTLVLAGGVTDGGVGLNKTGQGNLILASGGTFTGPLNINGGFVQLQDGGALTTGTTTIGVATTTPATLDLNGQALTQAATLVLNGGAGPAAKSSNAPAGLYNSSPGTASFFAGSTLLIGAATSTVNASIGGFGNIDLTNVIVQDSVAGSQFNKVGPDTLILGNANSFTGQFNITAGNVQLTGASGFTSSVTNPAVETAGATIDLNGQTVTTAKPLTLTGAGMTLVGAPNQLGALINSAAGAAAYPGNLTLAATTSIGGPSLQAGVNGGITLSGTETGAFQITKIGGNNLTLTNGTSAITLIDDQAGSLTLSGAGALPSTTNTNFIRQNATMTLDNSTTAVSNRTGNHGVWLSGSLVINGNSGAAVAEAITQGGNNIALGGGTTNNSGGNGTATFANGYGASTITLNAAGTAGVTLQVASTSTSIFNRGQGSSALLAGDNLGGTPGSGTATIVGNATSLGLSGNNGQSTGQAGAFGVANALIYPWAVVSTSATGVGTAFATYNGNTNGVAPLTGTNGNAANALATVPNIVGTASANSATGTTLTLSAATITALQAAGLAVNSPVVGAGVPGNDFVTAIGATTITLNAATTTTTNTQLSFYTPVAGGLSIPNVVSTAATNTLSTATVAQAINSLTLNNAAGSTLTINQGGLQIDSGGVLAVGTNGAAGTTQYVIGGAGTLTGTNTLARELIFHVTGTGTTLTVNAPIFGNQFVGSGLLNANNGTAPPNVGLTKADGGMLVLGARETYTGDTVINGGTLQLAGGNNTIFRPFATAPTAGNAAAGAVFQNLTVDFGGTLDLNGTTQAVANLRSGSGTQLAGGAIVNSNVAPATLAVALNTNQTWAGNLSNGQSIGAITGNSIGLTGSASGGSLNFVRDGNNTLTVNSPNTFGGSATLLGGATTLVDLGTFQNASAINVTRAALIWNDQGVQAVSNRLSSTTPITLNGGGLQFLTRAGTGSSPTAAISLGVLNLGIGASSVIVSSVGQGAQASVSFAGLGTRATGATVNFGNAAYLAGSNPNYYVTGLTNTNGIIGGWATVNALTTSGFGLTGSTNPTFAFATYDPAAGVRAIQYQPNTTYGAGVNTSVSSNGGTGTLPGLAGVPSTTTVNSLTLYNSNFAFTNGFDTLLIQSGGLLTAVGGGTGIGSVSVPGNIQSGAGNDLYLHNGAGTTTVNSKIIDNGSNNNVVLDSMSAAAVTFTFTNANTYGGTTYLSGANLNLNSLLGPAIPHDVVLSGSNNAATDSLVDSSTQLNWQLPNQLISTANITMNGASRLNLGSAANLPNQNVPNTQTINNLTINNDGGSNTADGPTIFTGAGTLTIAGTLNSSSPAETFTVPTINGFIALTNATPTINVDANLYNPANVGLAINANITAASLTKTGLGFLGIGGQSQNLVGTTFNLNVGGLAYSPSANSGYGSILGSAVVMAANTTIDTRGSAAQNAAANGLTLGSVASSSSSAVIMNGVQATAGTLTTGLDGTNTTYAGSFFSPYPTGQLNVTKIGTGTWSLTNNSQATVSNTLTVSGGAVNLGTAGGGNAGALSFQTYTLNTGGSALLDNTATAVNNRLGGAFYTTIGTLAPTVRTLNLQGGNLTVNGNSGAAITENLGTVNLTGGGIVTLNAALTGGVNATLQALGGQGAQTSLFIQGDGLGTAAGANIATLQFATAGAIGTTPGLTFPVAGGAGANGTFIKTIRPDVLVSSSASGTNPGFLTIDSATGLVRPLNSATELQALNAASGPTLPIGYTITSSLSSTTTVTVGSTAGLFVGEGVTGTGVPASAFIQSITDGTHYVLNAAATATASNSLTYGVLVGTQNVKTAGTTPLFANTTVDSVTLNSGGGFSSGIIAGNLYGSNGGLLTVTNTSTGILNTAGTSTIATTVANAGITADIHVLTGSTLAINGALTTTGGFTKSEGGALILGQQFLDNSTNETIAINGGTLQLNSGAANTLGIYLNSGGAPVGVNLAVNSGTLDLNGQNQLVSAVTSQNPLPFGGGTSGSPNIIITNSSGTAATFFTNAANTVFSGELTGNLNLDKSGNTTMTLSSPQTYTGTTNIRGGNITLRDSATLASTTINANFAELILDNTGLSTNNARISSTAALNLNGGALRVNQTSAQSSETFGTVTLNGGSNVFFANQFSNNTNSSTGTFTISNLVANNNSTFLYATQGSGGFNGAQNHLYLSNLNGVPFTASSLVNGIIGAQYIESNTGNQFQWASYSNLGGVTNPNTNIGGIATPNYGALGGGATVNANTGATAIGTVGQTLNTFRFADPAAAMTLGLNGSLDQLVLAAGGLLVSNNGNQALAIQGGAITAGALNTASTLYLQVGTQNTLTINSPFVNNGATLSATTGQWSGGTGALSLTRSTGSLTVTLTPQQVETVNVPSTATNTVTVPSSTGLFVGMGVTANNVLATANLSTVPAGTTITAISGTTVTLSANVAPSGTPTAGNQQLTFAPVLSTATGSTTLGSNSVSILAANLPSGFTPAVGMTIGSSVNIPGGATITGVTLGTTDTITLSSVATATSAVATLVFNPLNNAYTGTTTINASVDQAAGGTTNLSGNPGSIVIPGNLTINGGATVTMNTNQGQIASTSAITINGGGTLNLVGTNRFSTTLTFNNLGSNNVTPTVAVGALMDLSSTAAITANNDNNAFTPTISGTTLNLSSATGTTINTTGQSPNDLSISAAITTNALGTTTTTGQTITKTGAGSLVLPNANAAVLNWALNGGTIELGNATSLGAAGSTLSVSGTVGLVQSANASINIALPITVSGTTNLTLGQQYSNANNLTLAGAINLNNQSTTITVATPGMTAPVITGQITGTTPGFTKAGAGPLTLTPGTASTFTGPVTVSGGLLTEGNANAFGGAGNASADFTVASGAELNLNALALSVGSLAGGGIVTNSGASQTLTIGTSATNASFSGALTAATQANLSVTKTGTNNQTLSGTSFYTGATTVSNGTLTLRNASATASTPTLNNTAITVANGATLAVASGTTAGSPVATATNATVNIGDLAGINAGASLSLSAGGNLDLRDGTLSTFNILGAGTGTSLTTAATSNLFFEVGNAGADKIALSRAAAITGGTINLSALTGATGIPLGVVPLITAASGFTGTGTNNFTLGTTTLTLGAKTYTFTLAGAQDTTTQTALSVSVAAPTNAYWSGAVNANWSTGNLTGVTNFRTDATSNIDTQAIPTSASNVFFYTTTPAATNLSTTLDAPFSIASLTFLSTATAPVAIGNGGVSANTLTLGSAGLTVNSGSGADTISANVILGAAQSWTNNGANGLTVSGNVSNGANLLTVAGSGTTTVSGVIGNGAGGLTMAGPGTLVLTNTNTYTGATNVTSGKVALAVNATGPVSGSIAGSVNVSATATFGTVALNGGSAVTPATVTGSLTDSGTVAASTTAPLAITGGLTVNAAGIVSGGLAGPMASTSALFTTSSLTLQPGALLNIAMLNGYQPTADGSLYTLVSNTGANPVSGVFANADPNGAGQPMSFGTLFGGQSFTVVTASDGELFAVSYTGEGGAFSAAGGNDVVLMAVPEPSAVGSLLAGLASLAGLQRFRRRSAARAR